MPLYFIVLFAAILLVSYLAFLWIKKKSTPGIALENPPVYIIRPVEVPRSGHTDSYFIINVDLNSGGHQESDFMVVYESYNGTDPNIDGVLKVKSSNTPPQSWPMTLQVPIPYNTGVNTHNFEERHYYRINGNQIDTVKVPPVTIDDPR
jgi:hypothetical protein